MHQSLSSGISDISSNKQISFSQASEQGESLHSSLFSSLSTSTAPKSLISPEIQAMDPTLLSDIVSTTDGIPIKKLTNSSLLLMLKFKSLLGTVALGSRILKSIHKTTVQDWEEVKDVEKKISPGRERDRRIVDEVYVSPVTYFERGDDMSLFDIHPLYGIQLIDKYGNKIKSDHILKNKNVVALFFASYRCKRCDDLLPLLKEVYLEAAEQDKGFEIIMICEDSREEMKGWFRLYHGSWFAVDPDEPLGLGLVTAYGILAVPAIIVIDSRGVQITNTGVEDIEKMGKDVLVTWF